MVNYTWGDKWDEREKEEQLRRYYGPGGGYRGGSSSGGGSGGGKGYTSYPRRGGHTGRNIGIVLVAVAAIGGLIFFFNPLGIDFFDNRTANNESTSNIPAGNAGDNKHEPETTKVEYVVETRTLTVLNAGAFLSADDVRSFNLQIPNKDVSKLEGTITVDGEQFVNVEFQDAFGGVYCDQCSYKVYGESSGKAESAQNNKVDIPVDSGDALKLLISNGGDAELQTVSINLYVTYEETVEKVIQPVAEEEQTEPEVTPVVAEEEPETEQPQSKPEPASGIGRNIDPDELAARIHDLINEERVSRGLAALNWDSKLAGIAERHSEDMAENNYFEHDNLKGQDPTARAEAAGYDCRKNFGSYYTVGIAENIFQAWTYDSITYINGIPFYDWTTLEKLANDVVQGWMGSPGHRQNILDEQYDRQGIGAAIALNDKIYITEDFC
ncbi:MAG: CAP domain-containing protein [Nitrososphaera sp.]|jgi:uncharacterized protein YkwD